jgi:hypothetical protein
MEYPVSIAGDRDFLYPKTERYQDWSLENQTLAFLWQSDQSTLKYCSISMTDSCSMGLTAPFFLLGQLNENQLVDAPHAPNNVLKVEAPDGKSRHKSARERHFQISVVPKIFLKWSAVRIYFVDHGERRCRCF